MKKRNIIKANPNNNSVKFRIIILFTLFALQEQKIFAVSTTWIGTTTNWSTSGNWSNGVPTKSKDAIIATASAYPSISNSYDCGSLTLTGSGNIDFFGSGTLNIFGDLSNSTSNDFALDGLSGTIKFKGDGTVNADALITGTFYIYKVVIDKFTTSNIVSLANSTNLFVRHSLSLKKGDIDSRQGHSILTLDAIDNSGNWQTAYIDSVGLGHVIGKISCRQMVFQAFKSYHFLCSPVLDSNQTYWSTSMLEPFTNQTDYYSSWAYPSGGTIPDFLYYDETTADPVRSGASAIDAYGYKGLNPLTSNTGRVKRTQGVCARFAPYAPGGVLQPIQWTGIVNDGDINAPVSYTNNSENPDGLNLLGNPYPATVNWQAVYDDIAEFPVIYMFQTSGSEYAGTLLTWDAANNANSTLADSRVAIGQGFFIQANSTSSSSFTWKNSYRIASVDPTFQRQAKVQNALDIKLGGINNRDLTLIHFGDYNNTDKLPIKNASKFLNPQNSIYSIDGDQYITAANLAFPQTEIIIPIGIKIDENGSYFFEAANVNLPQTKYKAFLHDKLVKKMIEITPDFHYDFNADKGKHDDRFIIRVYNNENVSENSSTVNGIREFAYETESKLIFQLADLSNQNINVTIFDSNGKNVWQGQVNFQNGRGNIDKYNLPQGLLLINLNDGKKISNFKITNTN